MDWSNDNFFIQLNLKYVKFRPRLVAVIYSLCIYQNIMKYTGRNCRVSPIICLLFSAQSKTSGTINKRTYVYLLAKINPYGKILLRFLLNLSK